MKVFIFLWRKSTHFKCLAEKYRQALGIVANFIQDSDKVLFMNPYFSRAADWNWLHIVLGWNWNTQSMWMITVYWKFGHIDIRIGCIKETNVLGWYFVMTSWLLIIAWRHLETFSNFWSRFYWRHLAELAALSFSYMLSVIIYTALSIILSTLTSSTLRFI